MSRKSRFFKGIALFVIVAFSSMPQYGFALPQGADVVSGQATIDVNGNTMNVNVATDKMIANWQSFSIAHPEAVHFYQPSSNSVALNRVVGADPSSIMGTLTSTGKLFLINPNGVLFGQGSYVDTAGFVASTLGISNDDFLSGKYNFSGPEGSVINRGYISSPGGYVALLGNSVENSGTIVADLGSVALASGKAVTLSLDPQGLISVAVDEATSQNLEGKESAVKNTGNISAEGGKVLLTAEALDGVFDKAVNNEGIIEAKSLVDKTGEVKLIAEGENSLTSNTGTIDVSAKETGVDGGDIELSGGILDYYNGILNAQTIDGNSGSILFDPWNYIITDSDETYWNTLGNVGIGVSAGNGVYFNLTNDNILDLINLTSAIFSISAGKVVSLNDDSILTHGGGISLHTGFLSGGISLGTGAGLNSNGGNISLTGRKLNLTAKINAGIGNVNIHTWKGIADNHTGRDITAGKLTVWSSMGSFGDSLNSIDTRIKSADIHAGSGIYLNNNNAVGNNLNLLNLWSPKDIKVKTNRDLIAGKILTLNKVTLKSTTGSILDDLNDTTAIWANNISLTANGDIGAFFFTPTIELQQGLVDPGYLDIALGSGSLSFDTNSAPAGKGNIYINEVSSPNFNTSKVSSVNTPAGAQDLVFVNSAGDVTVDSLLDAGNDNLLLSGHNMDVNAGITSLGDIRLVLLGDSTNPNNLLVDANIESTGGMIYLSAGDDITQSAGTTIQTNNGAIVLNSDAWEGNGSGDITQNGLAQILSNGGDIRLQAGNALGFGGGNINLGLVDALTGSVSISAYNSAVIDNNGTARNINSGDLLIGAASGIGSGNAIETSVDNFSAVNTTSGNIEIDNTGDLNIVKAGFLSGVNNQALGGKVNINVDLIPAGNDLTVDSDAQITTNGGDIDLTADGNVYVNNISTDGTFTGNTPPASGTVTITATGGDIQDNYDKNSNPDDIYDINADNIILSAGGDISSDLKAPIELRSNGLTILDGYNVSLFHKGELDFGGFSGNSFTFINAGDLTISGDIVTTGGNIDLSVIEDPDLYINALLDSGGGDINLSATENIVQNADILTQGGNFTGSADSDANYSGYYNLMFGSEINTNNGTTQITADDITISGILDSGTGNVTIAPSKDQTIALASGAAFGDFRLSNDEVDNILTSGLITIGSNQAGTITINNLDQPGRSFKLVTSGDVLEQGDEHSVDITADSLIFDVAGSVGTLSNGIETEIGLLEGNVGNLININEFDDLALNTLTAKDVILTLGKLNCCGGGSGALTDNNGSAQNIIADTAILDTGTGIGSNDAIETMVGTLSARVRSTTTNGNIRIDNTGNLTLDDLAVPAWGYSVNNLGLGDVYITTHSDLTIASPIKALGNMVSLNVNGALIDGYYGRDVTAKSLELRLKKGMKYTSPAVNNYLETKVKEVAVYNSTSGDIKISNKGNLTVGSVGSTAGITNDASGGDVIVKVHSNLTLNEPTTTNGGNVTYKADENIIHNVNGDVMTSGGNFRGYAEKDYTLKDGASILTGDGNIDIYAGENVFLGSGPATLSDHFTLEELLFLESRGYTLKDFGYYSKDGNHSLSEGQVVLPSNAEGFYITMKEYSGGATRTYYTNPTLNPDGKEHLKVNDNGTITFNWEDLYGLGDRDFNDVIFQYTGLSGNPVYLGSYLSSNRNIFLTANSGAISQTSGNIYADNLMLSANTGITGVDTNDAVDTYVDNLSAVNSTGDIRIKNTKDLTIADLSGLNGLNPGVKGSNGITNGSGTVAITVVNDPDLYLDAAIVTSQGTVFLNTPDGGIYDDVSVGDTDTDVIAKELHMEARDAIGTSTPNGRIDTQVSNLWAKTLDGDVWINELDGVNLWDIQALGSTVDIITGGDTYAYSILATGSGLGDSAIVNLDINNGSLFVNNGSIQALRSDNGLAKVNMEAEQDINAQGSVIEAIVEDKGHAEVDMSTTGNVILRDSSILSRVNRGLDSALINLSADGYIGLNDSLVQATAVASGPANIDFTASDIFLNNGSAVRANSLGSFLSRIYFDADNVIRITDSRVVTNELNYGGLSRVRFDANNIGLIRSEVISRGLFTSAWISLLADNDIMIKDSLVSAFSKFAPSTIGGAYIGLHADSGSVTINNSTVRSIDPNDVGVASVNITAGQNINIGNDSLVLAKNFLDGESRINMKADNDINVENSTVKAEVDGNGNAAVGLYANNSITIDPSNILVTVNGDGDADINLTADSDSISILDSLVKSTVLGIGAASVDLNSGGDIDVTNSDLIAEAKDGGASIYAYSDLGDITISESDIEALSNNDNASIELTADGGSVTITNAAAATHNVKAYVTGDGNADLDINANGGDADITNADLTAEITGNGNAAVGLYADNSITIDDSTVEAATNGTGALNTAIVNINAGDNITMNNASLILADTAYIDAGTNMTMNNSSKIDAATLADITVGSLFTMKGTSSIDPANTNVTANDLVMNGSSNINADNTATLTISNDMTMNNDSYIEAGNDVTADVTHDLVMNGTTSIIAGNDIDISAGNDMFLTYLQAGYDVTLTADSDSTGVGAIVDNNAGSKNIKSTNLILSAATGIGSGNALETEVSNLDAVNTDANNIEIDNTGALTLKDLNSDDYAVLNSSGGDVDITTASPLYVESEVQAVGNGEINLAANGSDGDIVVRDGIYSEDGDINLTAKRDILTDGAWGDGITAVYSSGLGNINLNAVQDIILGSDPALYGNSYGYGDIYSNDGNIDLQAGRDITVDYYTWVGADGDGSITMNAGQNLSLITRVVGEESWIYTGSGDIDLTAGNDILIDALSEGVTSDTGNITLTAKNNVDLGYVATGSNVTVTADSDFSGFGAITDNNGFDLNIKADHLNMYAAGHIGNFFGVLPTKYMLTPDIGMLDTQVNSIDATSAQGGVYINETDAVDLLNIQSGATPSIYIFSGGDMNVGSIYDPTDVWLTTMGTMDGITLPNSLVETQDMHLWAKNIINQIQTDVSNIWAYSDTSSIYLYDWNGYASSTPKTFMHLRDIDALNTIFVFSGWYNLGDAVDVYADNVVSRNNGQILLQNNLANKGDIYVDNIATGSGLTGGFVKILGYNSIIDNNGSTNNISGYSLEADADNGIGSGNALETMLGRLYLDNSTSGNIEIDNTGDLFVEHAVNNGGDVKITAHSDIDVGYIEGTDVYLTAENGGGIYDAYNDYNTNVRANNLIMTAVDNIGDLADPFTILSDPFNPSNYAGMLDTDVDTLTASATDLFINESNDVTLSDVQAQGSTALIAAGGDVTINNLSALGAGLFDPAVAAVIAYNGAIDVTGQVNASNSSDGFGLAVLLAKEDINSGNITASGGMDGISLLEGFINDMFGLPLDIQAQYTYGSGIFLGSLAGDITLGDLSADVILAAALGLDEFVDDVETGEGNIYDVGDINAHYLGLLARNDIGTPDAPINTNIDILSAYSWDTGNIYVNQVNPDRLIELGLFLPIVDEEETGVLGASVAANDGIIHIASAGDMLVNSVVSPRGGVFLESTGGSIYAGNGWCPIVSQDDVGFLAAMLDDLLDGWSPGEGVLSEVIGEALVSTDGTLWDTVGGIDYFSPVMIGEIIGNESPYPAGPNVIAGGYSYFSAPLGTIGVGVPGEPVDAFNWYNPLAVCIQVIDSFHSAVPLGFTPVAGLTLNIGGSSAGEYTIDTGDGNGPLGISGAVSGIVRPGTTAVTGVYPSPAIDNTSTSPLNPPGYVFYDDTDASCCNPLFGPPAVNSSSGPAQIWPSYPNGAQYLTTRYLRAYYEILGPHRVSFAEPLQPTTFYAYHPILKTDESAFDDITLDVGAYEFINQNINLKNSLAPYFGGTEDKNKKKKKKSKSL